jgi:hypothetical protein
MNENKLNGSSEKVPFNALPSPQNNKKAVQSNLSGIFAKPAGPTNILHSAGKTNN